MRILRLQLVERSKQFAAGLLIGFLRIELADLVATTGRDLVDDSNRRTRVVRLEAIRAARALMDRADQADPSGRAPAGRSGDAVCLLAA